jgi:hypothetical protein
LSAAADVRAGVFCAFRAQLGNRTV